MALPKICNCHYPECKVSLCSSCTCLSLSEYRTEGYWKLLRAFELTSNSQVFCVFSKRTDKDFTLHYATRKDFSITALPRATFILTVLFRGRKEETDFLFFAIRHKLYPVLCEWTVSYPFMHFIKKDIYFLQDDFLCRQARHICLFWGGLFTFPNPCHHRQEGKESSI